MESEADYYRKFEEIKMYVPFLEIMIKRLERTCTANSETRQAQLEKMKSLMNLLKNQKKRMKMANLVKCEQVLLTLFMKVEERDRVQLGLCLPDNAVSSTNNLDGDAEFIREKIRAFTAAAAAKGIFVTSDNDDTLPEISRASEMEGPCTGSKEPALFQRRPKKPSPSPGRSAQKSPNKYQAAKRNYTRVLVSPEPSTSRWNADEGASTEKPLFSRRSPRRSPKRYSPSRDRKKERRKSSKTEKSKKTKGLNITLNVPEESLDSLNTKDILSRIMNCNDNDMDIETLREAKRQILSELNQTGAKYDDISDLLLKSCKGKSEKKKDEVEEGELSDSESEAIESIYGGLNSSQSTKTSGKSKVSEDIEQPRKIQICLVINPEDGKPGEIGKANETTKPLLDTDTSDFQMYGEKSENTEVKSVASGCIVDTSTLLADLEGENVNTMTNKPDDDDKELKEKSDSFDIIPKPANFYKPIVEQVPEEPNKTDENESLESKTTIETKIVANKDSEPEKQSQSPQKVEKVEEPKPVKSQDTTDISTETKESDVEIPLLHETVPTVEKPKEDVVSEIDILQALKNEILSESLTITGSDVVTPALHQPKLTKVASAQEIAPKKRISIEKYKEKSVLKPKATTPLFVKDTSSKDDLTKKQSLKLTMKECERFNFPVRLAMDDDDYSDEEGDKNVSIDDIYDDIAPKSPDNDESSEVLCTPPIIIPSDPIKNAAMAVASKADVDMRTLPLILSNVIPKPITSPVLNKEKNEKAPTPTQVNPDITKVPSDPRMRREMSQVNNKDDKPSYPLLPTPDRAPQPVPYPNMTPSRTPNMTPSRTPNMTPIRNPNMTPSLSARTFEIEDSATQKHVYAPMFTSLDSRERETSVAKDVIPSYKPERDIDSRRSRWESDSRDTRDPRASSMQRDTPDYHKSRYSDSYNANAEYNYKNTRYSVDRRADSSYSRSERSQTPVHPFGRSDCAPALTNPYGIPPLLDTPITPVHPFGRSDCPMTPSHPFGRSECPPTPNHPFGRSECPPTPIHPFGRNDCPTTPSHPFGRSDCPTTPSHPFGRSDCPSTPSHPFGRSDCPRTPSHPFGRGDMPMTPSHPFGRSDNVPRDPRLNRSSDYDKYQKHDRERSNYYRDRNSSSSGHKSDVHNKSYDSSESYRPYTERSGGRNDYHNDRYNKYNRDKGHFNRESMPRREPSVGRGGRAVSREPDNDNFYSRERNDYYNKGGNDYYNRNDHSRGHEMGPRRGFYRERSVGRSAPDDGPYRSSSRGPSVGRSMPPQEHDNRLSVKPDAGRSFTIDTSVNSTFQDFLDTGKKIQVFDYTFDRRKQRAASVGRSLTREPSVGRTMTRESSVGRTHFKPKQTFERIETPKKMDFKRASSVGRDIVGKDERSFKDIKADFELFKSKIQFKPVKVAERPPIVKKDERRAYDFDNRKSRKDLFDQKVVESSSRKPYSPKKNSRDPRLRRDQNEGNRNKSDDHGRKHVGIVYSNDNITKGTILGSGYGVKNYKIPKIKRPVEEKDEVPEKIEPLKKESDKTDPHKKVSQNEKEHDRKVSGKIDKKAVPKKEVEIKIKDKASVEKNDDNNIKTSKPKKSIEKLPEKKKIETKENKTVVNKKSSDSPQPQNIDTENVGKRVTRLSRKSETQPVVVAKRTSRKAVIYDSDSSDDNIKEVDSKMGTQESKEDKQSVSNAADDNTMDSQMDSSFGIDDLDMFSDNIVADPVIDNINALIADLDNELGPTKIVTPAEFSNDIIDNMLESITSSGKEDTKSLNEDEKLNDISEVINNDLNESGQSLDMKNNACKIDPVANASTSNISNNSTSTMNATVNSDAQTQLKEASKTSEQELKDNQPLLNQGPVDKTMSNSDNLVTTTDPEKLTDKAEDKKEEHSDVDGRSTPDSTITSKEIEQNRLSQESVPDSTNEVQNETSSMVSSTHESVETTSKEILEPTSSNKDTTPSIDSIGSILSILQNKTKIKELLSLLGEAENEKIKKKLEKLSEIVSDEDEDTKDSVDKVEITQKDKEIKDDVAVNTAGTHINEDETMPKADAMNEGETVDKKDSTDKTEDKTDTVVANVEKDLRENMTEENGDTSNEIQEKVTTPVEESDSEEVGPAEESEKAENEGNDDMVTPGKKLPLKKKPIKRGGGLRSRKGKWKKNAANPVKRITRSNTDKPKAKKKQSRELLKLQEDIKEMFMKDEILNATGIRMCRLAKLVEDKKDKEEALPVTSAPMVVLDKNKEIKALEESLLTAKPVKKKGKPIAKPQPVSTEIEKKPIKPKPPKYKPGPKSKKLAQKKNEDDPYQFESDSVSDVTNDESIDKSVDGKEGSDSGSESESLASSKSFESSEVLSDVKKKKRKRSSWKTGFIKPKKRKKAETKSTEIAVNDDTLIQKKPITIPDPNCFTDKSYCFRKNVTEYSCRLCTYSGEDNIVAHYKHHHPHSEIPLSRMDPQVAREAIEQCEEVNFQAISKIPTDKYVCRFCYKEFSKKKCVLESFFWHVVSMHTGEYKKICSECVNTTICPFNLDIPPPPKDVKGQLIGYICEKCNFTQISLENLKTHVIVRHNDEQTEVYTINLAVMSRKTINTLLKRFKASGTSEPETRVLRSSRSNQSVTEASDDHSNDSDSDHTSEPLANRISRVKKAPISPPSEKVAKAPYQTKITYENDDNLSDMSQPMANTETVVKVERDFVEEKQETTVKQEVTQVESTPATEDEPPPVTEQAPESHGSDDIFDYPHFKISYSDAGLKEYVCCINGHESHYKTNLLISMKRHVQIKHSETWDGYCFVCKVIVTPQGQQQKFKDCLQHFLDKHMDNFPVLEKPVEVEKPPEPPVVETASKSFITVRPLSELISSTVVAEPIETPPPILPKIESIVSLGAATPEPASSPSPYPPLVTEPEETDFKYEEVQADVMAKKHQVVLNSMMSKEKLTNVYKCAGRYCSFTSDSVEDALLHASTHNRVGGEGALRCSYCNFDSTGNAIDLVTHVFKSHGPCPYVCAYCFYRSASAQLVSAHSARAHAGRVPRALCSAAAPAPASQPMLPREVVVRYYVCPHACKYRTYTAQKFSDHIQQRHGSETWHSCYMCPETSGSVAELVEHMKSHQLNLYQCTWCVHGAHSEAALLAHSAAAHPARQPQAYLRLITTKEGTKEFRVLPLASFNKTKIEMEKVVPAGSKDNPVREAERAIELEKLIGHTNQMIESMATATEEPARDPEPMDTIEPELASSPPEDASGIEPPRLETPPPMSIEERSQMPTPVLKVEPQDDDEPKKDNPKLRPDVVYCLDSDEEDTPKAEVTPTKVAEVQKDSTEHQQVIDLSDDESTSSTPRKIRKSIEEDTDREKPVYRKIPFERVLKCPACCSIFKNVGGFKRHTSSCMSNLNDPAPCAHCRLITSSRDELVLHYTLDHSSSDTSTCGVCGKKFYSTNETKKHVKSAHKISKVVVSSNVLEDGAVVYTVAPAQGAQGARAQAPKRKLSGAGEPPHKMRKYGPQDVDRLPINPILDELVHCALCEFNTKVRLNMVRHLQFHAEQQPVPHSAPINPVPHLETNEKHFDRMVNLASSSIVTRAPATNASHAPATVTHTNLPPELAERYPKLVPQRQRFACGADGCSYISVDCELFKCHWNTLHAAADKFTCVHCPRITLALNTRLPNNNFPTISEHLSMHDSSLFACSVCPFYHYKKSTVASHVDEFHSDGRVVTVREEIDVTAVSSGLPAPTMDLKPWQCGLCDYKSLLRQEIIEHCGKTHQSKMQYKCANCPFRTSTLDNVTKHMTNSHPGKGNEVFYYFYREGTVPDDDGVPRWVRQRQKAGITDEIKTEVAEPTALENLLAAPQKPMTPATPAASVDLNIVKKEVGETSPESESVEALCQKYGQFCEPNGLNYKCPLCQVVMEDTRDAMQSHLYEELGYRRWVCVTCSYKAFHRAGMNDHINSEHRAKNQSPIQLPLDHSIEKWVSALLDHQTSLVLKNKDSLAKQKILTERPPRPSKPEEPPKTVEPKAKPTMAELEKAFGPLGVPSNMVYCCPKCNTKIKDEAGMRNHLESELTKIRWCCSQCTSTFQTYHEAQFHCKSAHAGQAARPREAERSPALRTQWLQAVIQVQKLSMRCLPLGASPPRASEPAEPAEPEDSLLVVRYEESVPNPEVSQPPPQPSPASPGSPDSPDSDDERLIIDEKKKPSATHACPHCDFSTKYQHVVVEHIYRHFNMKPYSCTLCDFQGYKSAVQHHIPSVHARPYSVELVRRSDLPAGPPVVGRLEPRGRKSDDTAKTDGKPSPEPKVVCLVCEKILNESEKEHHNHPDAKTEFVKKGKAVVKCSICSNLSLDVASVREHFSSTHPGVPSNYVFYRPSDAKEFHCGHCAKTFSTMKDLKAHNVVHSPLPLKYTSSLTPRGPRPGTSGTSIVLDDEADDETGKRKSSDDNLPPPKRIAKKSTTKAAIKTAAKSTKSPYDGDDEYSLTVMSDSVPSAIDKLSEVIQINPSVVKDVEKGGPTSSD